MSQVTAPTVGPPLARQRTLILTVLLGLAIAGWAVVLAQATGDDAMTGGGMGAMGHRMTAGPDLTMGRSAPLFFAMWVAMMVAMMFPAAAPMVLMYGRMRRSDPPSIAFFTASYIVLWFVFGALAYLVSAAVEAGASRSEWIAMNWGRAGGALLVLAGVYQLTPLKEVCLRHCRTPLSFVMTRWREGRSGAVRMGLMHGVYCMGCCWLLFLILIPLGVMNVAAMAAVATLVFAEKVLPRGRAVGALAASVMVVYGIAVSIHPALLPTVA
jgi:predicted metal-binding membrane protein